MLRVFLLISLINFLFPGAFFAQSVSIAEARTMPAGSLVTVRGLVTNGDELGKIRFMQDHSAGIALFPGSGSQPGFESSVLLGDSLEVSGYLVNYFGLLEISPILTFDIISRNRPLPTPKPVTLNNLNNDLEGQLVSIDCLDFSVSGTFSNSGSYTVSDALGNSSSIYLRSGHPMLGTPIPGQPTRIQAILSAYGDFQLLPRTIADFTPASCFYLISNLQQSEIQQNGFRLTWTSNLPATSMLRYGTTPGSLDQNIILEQSSTTQSVFLNNLQAGVIYWAQTAIAHGPDTIYSEVLPFATQSASSGQIKIYFNQGIDIAAANGLLPDGDSYAAVLAETLNRINSAVQTIDVAVYNNNRNDLVSALQVAQARGVRVRYIAAEATGNSALTPAPNFPVLYGNNSGLMHHKFLVIDANLPDKSWVMSGSLNWTSANMSQDYNNTLFIQDQSLARTYELEFQEMWGSSGAAPDPAKSRFGSDKKDNTPHRFDIAGRAIECYFSPSDQVTKQIVSAIQTTDYQASFAIFSFTKDEIGAAFTEAQNTGAWVRGMVENINDVGAEFPVLLSNNVPVKDHSASGLLHHKYVVIDAGTPSSNPTIVTGSHNWTQAAESSNDENTLIIHDSNLATLFQAEFERRWLETGTFTQTVATGNFEIYPNPVRERLFLRHREGINWSGAVAVRDMLGRCIYAADVSGPAASIDLSSLPAGNYFISLNTDRGLASFPIQTLPH